MLPDLRVLCIPVALRHSCTPVYWTELLPPRSPG